MQIDITRILPAIRVPTLGVGWTFSDRGETPLKGFPQPVRTWELLW